MWTYKQSTGEMIDADGEVIGTGYAGCGAGMNNPTMQHVKNIGPIPAGRYIIGPLQAEHGHLGTNVAELIPDPRNEMFGRSGFFIHGRKSPTDLTASNGCIEQDHEPRMRVLTSSDRYLEVTA